MLLNSLLEEESKFGYKWSELDDFLHDWDVEYKVLANKIQILNYNFLVNMTDYEKKAFVKIFYHSRGHFKDFLWFVGNNAPNKKIKDIIIKNIADEFNCDDLSHEQHYLSYATAQGVDLREEFIEEKYYTQEMREFNKVQLQWMSKRDWESQFSAFSAYERLDKYDYEYLSPICGDKEHEFFKIHRKAKHYSYTSKILEEIWVGNKMKVIEAFLFIGITQLKMWRDLSRLVVECEDMVC